MADEFTSDKLETIALKIVRGAANKNNFIVLKMLPSTISEIMEETRLSKSAVNSRVNELVRLCLADRRKGTGIVSISEFGEPIVRVITKIKEEAALNVKKNIVEEDK